jgi:hypothetical protein
MAFTAEVGRVRRFLTWPDCASDVVWCIDGHRLCASDGVSFVG